MNPSLDKLEKEAVVPKEFETSKEEDVAVGLQGRTTCKYGISGFFLPPNSKGFFPSILLSPCVRSSLYRPR